MAKTKAPLNQTPEGFKSFRARVRAKRRKLRVKQYEADKKRILGR